MVRKYTLLLIAALIGCDSSEPGIPFDLTGHWQSDFYAGIEGADLTADIRHDVSSGELRGEVVVTIKGFVSMGELSGHLRENRSVRMTLPVRGTDFLFTGTASEDSIAGRYLHPDGDDSSTLLFKRLR